MYCVRNHVLVNYWKIKRTHKINEKNFLFWELCSNTIFRIICYGIIKDV